MGSFDMNGSFSRIPIQTGMDVTVVISLKRTISGKTQFLPLTYPVKGKYYDYGYCHKFSETPETKAICEFFEEPGMEEVTDFIYSMTIHGDYEDGLERIKAGRKLYADEEPRFLKYQRILEKLKKNVKGDSFSGAPENLRPDVRQEILRWQESQMKAHQELLDSYSLSLFYEHTSVFEALMSVDPWSYPSETPGWGKYDPDHDNLFLITKDLPFPEGLCRLWTNFQTESKTFEFSETSIEGQESCPQMWYQVGKAIQEIWKDWIE